MPHTLGPQEVRTTMEDVNWCQCEPLWKKSQMRAAAPRHRACKQRTQTQESKGAGPLKSWHTCNSKSRNKEGPMLSWHFKLHLANLLQGKHILGKDAPWLVGIGVICRARAVVQNTRAKKKKERGETIWRGRTYLANDALQLVRIGVIANNLEGNYKREYEKVVTRGALCGREASLEALYEVQHSKGDGHVKPRTMEHVHNEMF